MPKPSRPLLHEWMHRFEVVKDLRVIRVWTQRGEKLSPSEAQESFASQHAEMRSLITDQGWKSSRLPERLAALPYVNAVEDVDALGNGRLVYVDWP